jgi:hypothetical protein
MSELNTFLIADPRYADVTSSVSVAVKDGPASVIPQSYTHNSNSQSSTVYDINVPSENTLCDRNLKVEGYVRVTYTTNVAAADPEFQFEVVPAAFPLNQSLQSVSLRINNSKVSVQTADVLNVITKQYHQKFLSQHCQMTPNLVDKYFAKCSDAASNDATSSYMYGVKFAEMDSDTVGRANSDYTVVASIGGTVYEPVDGVFTIPAAADSILTLRCSVRVSESLMALPTAEIKENESGYLSIKYLELMLQYNDCRNCFNISADKIWSSTSGNDTSSNVLDDAAKLNLRYMSLHASQYSKLNSKNILPYDEYVAHKRAFISLDAGGTETSDVISMRQIPEKLFIILRPQYKSMKPNHSNNLAFSISKMNITFNNVSGLLSNYTDRDLYVMSRRNDSQQTWEEFSGKVRNGPSSDATDIASLGSIVVIDPVRDLGLSDFLSSGSLGQFSFQCTIQYNNIHGHSNASTAALSTTGFNECEMVIISNYGGILINDKGASSVMSGLLTKQAVLEAKSSGKSVVDYEQIQQLTGGNFGKMGTSTLGSVVDKFKDKGKKMVGDYSKKTVDDIQDKLSKYM